MSQLKIKHGSKPIKYFEKENWSKQGFFDYLF